MDRKFGDMPFVAHLQNNACKGEAMEKDSQALTVVTDAYKTAIAYCGDWHNRAWNRFNYLLAIQSALIVLYFGSSLSTKFTPSVLLPIFGIILSAFMYVQGAHDVYGLGRFESNITKLKTQILKTLELSEEEYPLPFEDYNKPFKPKQQFIFRNIASWRFRKFWTAQVPAYTGLALLIIWVVTLISALR